MVPRQKFGNTSICLISSSSTEKANTCQPFTRTAVDTLTEARQPWAVRGWHQWWDQFLDGLPNGFVGRLLVCACVCLNTCGDLLFKNHKAWEFEIGIYTLVKQKSLSWVQLFATPWTVAHQAPVSMESWGKNTGVGCHFLLQGIFAIQGSNLGLLHYRQILYQPSHQGSPNK